MNRYVGLKVATQVLNVCPDKCWFAVLCRVWLHCSHNLMSSSGGSISHVLQQVAARTLQTVTSELHKSN